MAVSVALRSVAMSAAAVIIGGVAAAAAIGVIII